ncbi:MAG: flagellar basal body-associated FliL family protein [Leptospiraceae bacterium]|nr:flagellar basal body-associated FliL family protein [Leptospiraceae bacterium]
MSRGTKIFLIVLISIVSLVGLGLGTMFGSAYLAYWLGKEEAEEQFKEVSSLAVVDPPPALQSHNFGRPFQIPLKDGGTIKLEISLGFEQDASKLAAEIQSRDSQIRQIIRSTLARHTAKSLETARAKLKLRDELRSDINSILEAGAIREVYFTMFVVSAPR